MNVLLLSKHFFLKNQFNFVKKKFFFFVQLFPVAHFIEEKKNWGHRQRGKSFQNFNQFDKCCTKIHQKICTTGKKSYFDYSFFIFIFIFILF